MPKNAFDPDRLLDSFHARVAASQRQIDLNTVLGGWKPDPTGSRLQRRPEPAQETPRSSRPAARRHIDLDQVSDAVAIDEPPSATATHGSANGSSAAHTMPASRAGAIALTGGTGAARHPRLLVNWAPGAWIGAYKQVSAAVSDIGGSRHGPVVDIRPPQALYGLWGPRLGSDRPMTGRWPSKVLIGDSASTDPVGVAAATLLPLLPEGACLWLCDDAIDWALLAELVLHHEPALKPLQIGTLRSFAEGERRQDFQRVNDAYAQPAPGRPVQRR